MRLSLFFSVIPAKAGSPSDRRNWTPAFAGMTGSL